MSTQAWSELEASKGRQQQAWDSLSPDQKLAALESDKRALRDQLRREAHTRGNAGISRAIDKIDAQIAAIKAAAKSA